ncbi:MAG: putative diguanylate cyclase [Methanocella sp. PtaU1.Bin125]|nr:MAG: putative diguanylate cyclase [Methanocella sp. PtaU1.Bin125]
MEGYDKELASIKETLKAHPRGLTVTDISKLIKLNRNSVSKYLEILVVSGQVEMKMQGPSKVYFLSRRMPVSALLSFSSDIVVLVDEEMRVTFANDRLYEVTGASRDRVVGRKIADLPLLSEPEVVAAVREAHEGRESVRELTIPSGKDTAASGAGKACYRARFSPAVFEDGQAGVTLIFEDVGKQKLAEDRLKASEKKYRQLVETANEGIWVIDMNNRTTFVNSRLADMLGYRVEEMIGTRVDEHMPPKSEAVMGKHQAGMDRGASTSVETTLISKNGRRISVLMHMSMLTDDQGRPSGALSMVTDITDRKRMEEELKAARDSLASRVLEQTRELTEMNAALKQEIAERRLVEEALRLDEARLEALLALNEMESAPVERLAEYALERAVEQTGSRVGYILTPDEHGRKARIFIVSREVRRLSRLDPSTAEFDLNEAILCTEPFRTGRPAIENDYLNRPGKRGLPDGHIPVRRTLGVPVLDGGRVAAVALLGNKESDYTPADVRQVSLIMNGLWKAVLQRRAANALAESEARFRYTFDQSPIGAAIVSLDSRFQRVNPELCRITGYGSEELLAMRFTDITHPDDRQASMENVRALQAGEVEQFEMEKRYLRKDGRVVYGRTVVRMVKDAAGRPLYFLPLIRDITDWKRAEDALKRTQRFQETLISNLPGMVYRCRNDRDWTMEYVSDGCLALTGYRPDDLVHNRGIAYNDLIHPDDREKVWERIQDALAKEGPFQLSYRIRTAKGEEKWVWEQGRRAPGEKPGDIALEGFITDITDRKRAEEALRESEVRFRSLIYNSSDIIRIIDREGRIVFDSPSSEKLLGYPAGYTIGKSPLEFIHPDDRARVEADLGQVYSMTNPGIPTEFRVRKANGDYLDVESIGMNMIGVPGVDGIVINTRPITERKAAEAALCESEAKFRSFIEQSFDGIVLSDHNGNVIEFNRRMEEITGLKREDVMGKPVWEFQSRLQADAQQTPERKRMIEDRVRQAFTTHDSPLYNRYIESRITLADGRQRIIQSMLFPVKLDGSFMIGSVHRDITDLPRSSEPGPGTGPGGV